jgi:hypothetical protein
MLGPKLLGGSRIHVGSRVFPASFIKVGDPARFSSKREKEAEMVQSKRIEDRCLVTVGRVLAIGAVLLFCHSPAKCQDRERPRTEREVAQEQLEVMRLGLHALREAERNDAAELLQRAIRAREVILERRRDDEAARIRERSPNRAVQAELLATAARIWRGYGQAERAQAVARLAEQLAGGDRGPREGGDRPERSPGDRLERSLGDRLERDRGDRPDRDRGDRAERERETPRDRGVAEVMERLERLEDRLTELTEAVERLERHLREIKDRLD